MNPQTESYIAFAADVAEMGVRPPNWFDEENWNTVKDEAFVTSLSIEKRINLFFSTKQEGNENRDSSSEDEDDRADFRIDPETGEKMFGETNPTTRTAEEIFVENFISELEPNELETSNFDTITFQENIGPFDNGELLSNFFGSFSDEIFNDETLTLLTDDLSQTETIESPDILPPSTNRSNFQPNSDEELLIRYSIPLTVEQITLSTTEEYNQHLIMLKSLNPEQIQTIKDIRRRGKNKIAAQNCRKRKAVGVESLAEEVDELKKMKEELEEQKRDFEQKISETRRKYELLHRKILPHRNLPPAIAVN